jgi:hypothetical protein
MATIDLGKIKIVWKGTYSGGTAYVVDEAVVHNGSSYICVANTTGNAPPNATYWNVLAQAGTDGTDVGTTLTTQGDILYRDGSGLQRLAAGTAGHVLQTGGAGANPSWTAVSSDYVKIAQTNITSNTASVDFIDGTGGVVLDSTYRIYKLIGSYRGTTGGAEMQIRVINGGSNTRSSGYLCEAFRSYYSGGTSRAAATDKIVRSIGGVQETAGQRSNFEATFFNMSDADHNTTAHCQYAAIDGANETEDQVNNGISSGVYTTPEAHNGINFSLSTGSVGEAELTLIGIKG